MSLLITRPEHDLTTRYLSKWSEEIISEAEKKHIEVIDLDGEKAERTRFIGTLEKKAPDFVFMNGHGSADIIGGHDNAPLLTGSDEGVKDKVIYARACKSAKRLGPQAVENGAKVYIGYEEDFIFMYEPAQIGHPADDETAKLFLEPSNQIPLSILKGHSVEEAQERSKARYQQNIDNLFSRKMTKEEQQILFYLSWDLRYQVCLGDKDATI